MANTNTPIVTFWRKLDGQIVAQKDARFFPIPLGSSFGEDTETRQAIADNFDNAPLLENGFDITGAEVIANVTPAN